MKSLPAYFCILALCLIGNVAFAQPYSVIDLGAFPNSVSAVNALNNSNRFAGTLSVSNTSFAVLYGGAWTNLGTLGGTNSAGTSLNDSMRVVGRARNATGNPRAFLWTPGGTDGFASNPQMKDLGTLSGGSAAEADGINNAGQITGYSQSSKGDHAYRYTSGTMTDIGNLLPNNHNSYGYGINTAGHVVGVDYDNAFNKSYAFIYNGSTATSLQLSANDTYGVAINNNDQIVGYFTDGTTYFDHAFRYTNGFADLGTLGGDYSYANAINNSNVIVGGSFIDAADSIYHAFICSNSTLVDLNNLLDDSGSGWVLNEARAISDSGRIIGVGTLNGQKHAFLLAMLPPGITNQPASQTVTASNSATFTVAATGSTPLNYQWLFNGSPITGAVASSYTLPLALTNNAGNYTVIVTNNYGAVTSAVATLTIVVPIPPTITGVKFAGTNALVSFTTVVAGSYFLQARTNLITGFWGDVTLSNIVGNGSVVTATNFGGATSPSCFYRIRFALP